MNRLLSLMLLLSPLGCTGTDKDTSTPSTTDSGADDSGGDDSTVVDNCPIFAIDTLIVNITNAAVGSAVTRELTITNDCAGDYPLVITAALGTDSESYFSADVGTFTVPPGISKTIAIYYTAPDFEIHRASVDLTTNDSGNESLNIPITGQAVSDSDEDGHESTAAGGDDCDDADPDAYPGALDTWYDGLDSDCMGDDDYDQDLDGYQSDDYGGEDCDDSDADISPDATDTWYDGIDSDCDGENDYDRDGDGQTSTDYGGYDCNDKDASIYYGAEETPYDGIDGNCDGYSDYDGDLDGYEGEEFGGEDCDDEDATINPDADDLDDDYDTDCDGLLDEDAVIEGDILITEIMLDPSAVGDSVGEWFEIYNDSSDTVDMIGWTVTDDDTDSFTITSSLTIKPGKYKVFAAEGDVSLNGGVPNDFEYDRTTFKMDNSRDAVYLWAGDRQITGVLYNGSWAKASGYATSLDPGSFDYTYQNDPDYWCKSSAAFGDGDYGTPGGTNTGC